MQLGMAIYLRCGQWTYTHKCVCRPAVSRHQGRITLFTTLSYWLTRSHDNQRLCRHFVQEIEASKWEGQINNREGNWVHEIIELIDYSLFSGTCSETNTNILSQNKHNRKRAGPFCGIREITVWCQVAGMPGKSLLKSRFKCSGKHMSECDMGTTRSVAVRNYSPHGKKWHTPTRPGTYFKKKVSEFPIYNVGHNLFSFFY